MKKPGEALAFASVDVSEKRVDPRGVFNENRPGRRFSARCEPHLQAATVFGIGGSTDQTIPLQSIKQSGDGGAGHPELFGQHMGRGRLASPLKNADEHETGFRQPVRPKAGRAILINGRSQGKNLEAGVQAARWHVLLPSFRKNGVVFGVKKHNKAAYYMATHQCQRLAAFVATDDHHLGSRAGSRPNSVWRRTRPAQRP